MAGLRGERMMREPATVRAQRGRRVCDLPVADRAVPNARGRMPMAGLRGERMMREPATVRA